MAKEKKIYEWSYYLIDNTVTTLIENDKIAKVKSKKTKGVNDIAERIVAERTEYRKETIANIIRMANAAKLDFLSQGETVNDELVVMEPGIQGNYLENTAFDERVHKCVVNVRAGNDVHKMLRQVKGVYNGLSLDNGGASIDGFTDSTTGAVDGEVTPGKTITVAGKKIRIVPEDGETVESCITYLNHATNEVTTQEDAPAINDPSRIVLQLPMLAPGAYSMTIKTLYSSTSILLKAPRYITSKIKLTVNG